MQQNTPLQNSLLFFHQKIVTRVTLTLMGFFCNCLNVFYCFYSVCTTYECAFILLPFVVNTQLYRPSEEKNSYV